MPSLPTSTPSQRPKRAHLNLFYPRVCVMGRREEGGGTQRTQSVAVESSGLPLCSAVLAGERRSDLAN